jgi:WD40 repeat protein
MSDDLRHTAAVTAVALHPDGSRAASGDAEGWLVLWDPRDGRALRAIKAHQSRVTALALDAGAGRILTAGADKTWKTWDLESGRCLDMIAGHSRLLAIAAPARPGLDGVVVSRSFDHRNVTLLGVAAGAFLGTLTQERSGLSCFAFHPTFARAISGGWEGMVHVWDLDRAACLLSVRRHRAEVTAVAVLPDGERAISADAEGRLSIWSLATGDEERAIAAHRGRVTALAAAAFAQPAALTGGADARLRGWDLSSGACLAEWQAAGPVTACALGRSEPSLSADGYRAPALTRDRALVGAGDETGHLGFFEWAPFPAAPSG